jgi:AcrR family transcriptional regulator
VNRKEDEMLKKKKVSGRDKALEAAEEVFAEYGYDGATMDQIAAKAGINKMLIYYHFRSKEEILAELLRANQQKIVEIVPIMLPDELRLDDNFAANFVDKLFEIFIARQNILRIIIMEGMKLSKKDTTFFEIMQPFEDAFLERFKRLGLPPENVDSLKKRSFFMLEMPLMLFFSIGDKYAEYFGYDKEVFLSEFKKLIRQTLDLMIRDEFPERSKTEEK